jgi:LmbE family N-acetylglucosaminyl deacetylase
MRDREPGVPAQIRTSRSDSIHAMDPRPTILAIHGHPDDETVHIGGTLARYAAQGARVVCVTATRGELGEIVDPVLATPENRARLGEIRMKEMERALAILGPIESRWLGYRDSGVAGDPHNGDADAFSAADPEEAASRVARLIRELRPQVVITHNQFGDDGHPDHVAAARAAQTAFEQAGDPTAWPEQLTGTGLEPWEPLKLYEGCAQLGRREKVRRLMAESGIAATIPVLARAALRWRPARERLRARVAAAQVHPTTTRVDVTPWLASRTAAIRAFRTQVPPSSPLLAMTTDEQRVMVPTEDYALRVSRVATSLPEDDLLAGIPALAAANDPGSTPTVASRSPQECRL